MLQIASMVKKNIKNYLESFSFVFNKFEEKTEIAGVIGNIWEAVEKSDDELLKEIFEFLM